MELSQDLLLPILIVTIIANIAIVLVLLASVMVVGGVVLGPAEDAALDGSGTGGLIAGAVWDLLAVSVEADRAALIWHAQDETASTRWHLQDVIVPDRFAAALAVEGHVSRVYRSWYRQHARD
mgnify:CR=1 FL=1